MLCSGWRVLRCHEHGMDRDGALDEVARHFNPVNAP
jgi:hypothetical protein